MAAEDFVFSVDYWFCQRQATKKRLVTAVPAPFHDSGSQSLSLWGPPEAPPAVACLSLRGDSLPLSSSRKPILLRDSWIPVSHNLSASNP